MPLEPDLWLSYLSLFFTAVVDAVVEVAFTVFEITAIAFVVIAFGCFYSSYLLDFDPREWKNGMSMLRDVTGIPNQTSTLHSHWLNFLFIQWTM
jgi:hypothetical protein